MNACFAAVQAIVLNLEKALSSRLPTEQNERFVRGIILKSCIWQVSLTVMLKQA